MMEIMHQIYRVTILGLLSVTISADLRAATYYVSPFGTDNAQRDGSEDEPWATVRFALNQVGGGNTIVMMPGIYIGPILVGRSAAYDDSGSEESPTIIRSQYLWQALVISSSAHGVYDPAEDVNPDPNIKEWVWASWLVVDGLQVVQRPPITTTETVSGIKLNGDHCRMVNNWVHNGTWGDGNGLEGYGDYTIVEHNWVEAWGTTWHGHDAYLAGDGLVIRGNVFCNARGGCGLHLYSSTCSGCTNCIVEDNLCFGNATRGIVVDFPYTKEDACDLSQEVRQSSNVVQGNTSVSNGRYGIAMVGGPNVIETIGGSLIVSYQSQCISNIVMDNLGVDYSEPDDIGPASIAVHTLATESLQWNTCSPDCGSDCLVPSVAISNNLLDVAPETMDDQQLCYSTITGNAVVDWITPADVFLNPAAGDYRLKEAWLVANGLDEVLEMGAPMYSLCGGQALFRAGGAVFVSFGAGDDANSGSWPAVKGKGTVTAVGGTVLAWTPTSGWPNVGDLSIQVHRDTIRISGGDEGLNGSDVFLITGIDKVNNQLTISPSMQQAFSDAPAVIGGAWATPDRVAEVADVGAPEFGETVTVWVEPIWEEPSEPDATPARYIAAPIWGQGDWGKEYWAGIQ